MFGDWEEICGISGGASLAPASSEEFPTIERGGLKLNLSCFLLQTKEKRARWFVGVGGGGGGGGCEGNGTVRVG